MPPPPANAEKDAAIGMLIAAAIFAIMDQEKSFQDIKRLAQQFKE